MASDFLTGLASMIESQYSVGENSVHSLDIIDSGHVVKLGKLGDFAKQVDQSAERKYLEQGFTRYDAFNVAPNQFETLWQEPNATVLIKKRAFSTLSENYRSDFMSQEEKLYLKATTLLFQNKCRQIATFERLSKIERVANSAGQLDDQLMPLIISLVDEAVNDFADFSPGEGEGDFSSFNDASASSAGAGLKQLNNVVDKIRKVYAFSNDNMYTTWLTDQVNLFKSVFGTGTGVIELTNVMQFSTTTSVGFNGGSFNLSIADPYKLMQIMDYDIEKAISDATNYVANKKIFQLGKDSLDKIAANNIKKLNDARAARGASNIEFIQSPDTLLGKRVRAIIEHSGIEINFSYDPVPSLSSLVSDGGVNVSAESLRGGPEVGDEGLDNHSSTRTPGSDIRSLVATSEVSLFSDAVSAIFTALEFRQSSQSVPARQADFNDPSGKSQLDLNYVRRKMRFHYSGKQIVQPMDQVHIYIGSKSQVDKKILSGLQNMFTGLGFFQNLDNNIFDLKNQFNTLFNPSANIDMQLEKSVFVGPEFPNAIWAMMRNTFVNDKSGTHVFAGVVGSVGREDVPGKNVVNVSGKDNTAFFDYGTINMNPGVDTFNGPLYDPLTPFKTRFDTITTNFSNQIPEFLDENQAFLASQNFNQGLIKYKSGRNAGKPVTLESFFQDKQITKDGHIRSIYHTPDGLVYKWKEGIGTFTYNVDSFNATDPERVGIPAVTVDPFAGQDIMNVLSLLITGVPYNYATYYKGMLDTPARDPHSGQDAAISFYNSLSTTLKKNNLLWGAFIPFKRLVLDDQSYNAMIDQQVSILNQNDAITSKLTKIQDLQYKLYISSVIPTDGQTAQDKSGIESLKQSIGAARADLNNDLYALKQDIIGKIPVSVVGNDVSFDPDQKTSNTSLSEPDVRTELRRRINFLTRRLSWAVRANEDKNLFIVDDTYDKDYDILAIEKQFKGKMQQFSNEYTTVRDKIVTIAGLLNLEVFCDTQGHIKIRPQQYNRMPSSVFYRMMQLKQLNGIQVYPNFLETLFINQLGSLSNRLGILELEIRLDGAVLGITNDDTLANYLNSSRIDTTPFKFVSDVNGFVQDLQGVINTSNPEQALSQVPATFDSVLATQGATTSVFNAIDRAQLVAATLPGSVFTASITGDYINTLITNIFNRSGQHITLDNFVLPQPTGVVVKPPSSVVDVIKVTNDLAEKISERQKLLKSLSSSLKNAKEAMSLDADPNNTGNKLLFPDIYGNKNIPEIFAHMIEDESYDDYGAFSGQRYVIKNYQIKRLFVEEVPPAYTMIEVNGQIDPFISNNQLPQDFQGAFPSGGNAIVTAAAVDYDLWRMYGFRSIHSIYAPYLADPDNQCAPYAVSLLSRARKEILQGSITIAGNEFMQPGEVVYIEDTGQLFYVDTVNHSLTFSTGFTTTLTLKYGHNPGEYIPTPLDMVGKLLYNNRDTATSISYRQSNSFGDIPLGALVANQAPSETEQETDIITAGVFGEFNLKVISNILYTSAGVLNSNQKLGSNQVVNVELRIFFNSKKGSIDPRLSNARNALKQILTGKASTKDKALVDKPDIQFDPTHVIFADIDISSTSEPRSPSQKAVDLARNVLVSFPGSGGTINLTGAPNTSTQDPITAAMSTYVIDCVLTFNKSS